MLRDVAPVLASFNVRSVIVGPGAKSLPGEGGVQEKMTLRTLCSILGLRRHKGKIRNSSADGYRHAGPFFCAQMTFRDGNSRYGLERMLRIKALQRKLNCQTDGGGRRGALIRAHFLSLVQMSEMTAPPDAAGTTGSGTGLVL